MKKKKKLKNSWGTLFSLISLIVFALSFILIGIDFWKNKKPIILVKYDQQFEEYGSNYSEEPNILVIGKLHEGLSENLYGFFKDFQKEIKETFTCNENDIYSFGIEEINNENDYLCINLLKFYAVNSKYSNVIIFGIQFEREFSVIVKHKNYLFDNKSNNFLQGDIELYKIEGTEQNKGVSLTLVNIITLLNEDLFIDDLEIQEDFLGVLYSSKTKDPILTFSSYYSKTGLVFEYHYKKIQDYLGECISIHKMFIYIFIFILSFIDYKIKIQGEKEQDSEAKLGDNYDYSIERLVNNLSTNNENENENENENRVIRNNNNRQYINNIQNNIQKSYKKLNAEYQLSNNKSKITKLDFFTFQSHLYLNGNNKQNSIIGGVFSLLFISLSVFTLFFFGNEFIFKKNPKINIKYIIEDEENKVFNDEDTDLLENKFIAVKFNKKYIEKRSNEEIRSSIYSFKSNIAFANDRTENENGNFNCSDFILNTIGFNKNEEVAIALS